MERHDRAPVATFFVDAQLSVDEHVELSEGAAHHARVKRLVEGDFVRLSDGVGHHALGHLASMSRKSTTVDVESVESVAPLRSIHLRVPVADRDRMLWLAEKSVELGIASWQAVRFRRSGSVSPRGEGDVFREKIRTRMISALEQSGGAWLPQIVTEVSVESLAAEQHVLPIILDHGGVPLRGFLDTNTRAVPTIIVGPEGGLEPDERSLLIDAGWAPVRLAANILRFETAGIAAVAAFRAMELPNEK